LGIEAYVTTISGSSGSDKAGTTSSSDRENTSGRKRTRGAQPGNTLALKHGSWSASRGLARRAWVRQLIAHLDDLIVRAKAEHQQELARARFAQTAAGESERAG
jgi:hypothetical protein